MFKLFFKWHRRLAPIIVVPVIIWCLSGLTHPLMSNVFSIHLQHHALQPAPPDVTQSYIPLNTVLTRQERVTDQARLLQLGDDLVYQLQHRTQTHQLDAYGPAGPTPWLDNTYIDIRTGKTIPDGDHRYAEQLARYFLGDHTAKVVDIEKITAFAGQYHAINRFLPVYRVRFDRDDQADIYVDLQQSRLAYADTKGRRALQWVFRNFHTLDWLGETYHPLRLGIVTILVILMLMMGLAGLATLILKRNRAQIKGPVRRWHRRLGWVLAISTIGFASSGLHTVLMKYERHTEFAYVAPAGFTAASLTLDPLKLFNHNTVNFSVAMVGGEPMYQLHDINDKKKQLRYVHANSGETRLNGDKQYATQLALAAAGLTHANIKSIDERHAFGRGYPVIFKRLPVQKVTLQQKDRLGYFVETQTGEIAGKRSVKGFLQAIHFQWLHKYHFLDKALSRGQRDAVLSVIVIGILGMATMGWVLLLRRKS